MGKTYRHICISSIPCDYVLSLPHTKSDAAPNGADRVFWRGGYKDFAPTELVAFSSSESCLKDRYPSQV